MNQGGEQGHDDYGLPPVDIEIPDDARELYREVQAYHRELRAVRRHERSIRLRAPFRRSGVAIPLLAGCLIAALVAVMISAMFTQNPYLAGTGATGGSSSNLSGASGGQSRSPGTSTSSANPSSAPSSALGGVPQAKARLPGKTINVAGRQVPLRTLISAALAIVPANCDCKVAVGRLLAQAQLAGVIVYLVGPRGSKVADLDRLVTPAARRAKSTRVATDYRDVLTSNFRTAGLTVLFVDSHGLVVTVASRLGPDLMLTKQLQRLRG